MDDYEIDDEVYCPYCGYTPLHNRFCTNLFCEDGYIDEYEDDPINFMQGESLRQCPDCAGTGVEWWCPKCGRNLSGDKKLQGQFRSLEALWNNDESITNNKP